MTRCLSFHPTVGALFLTGLVMAVLAVPTPASTSGAPSVTVCATGCTFTTIQAALNAAVPGELITVMAGTYAGPITIGTNVTLAGTGSPMIQTACSTSEPIVLITAGTTAVI